MKSKASNGYIPMPLPLKESLLEWFTVNPYDYVVCKEDGSFFNSESINNNIKKVAKKRGIKFTLHALRHTYTTNLVKSGVDVKTAQELLRHSNFNTTMSIYAHVTDEQKKEAINSVFSNNSCNFGVIEEINKNPIS